MGAKRGTTMPLKNFYTIKETLCFIVTEFEELFCKFFNNGKSLAPDPPGRIINFHLCFFFCN